MFFKSNRKNKNITFDGFRKYSSISSWDIENWKKENSKKYSEFIRFGGGSSGMYNMNDTKTREFVKKYKEYIHKSELYYPDKRLK